MKDYFENNNKIAEIQKLTIENDLNIIVDNKLLLRGHITKKVAIEKTEILDKSLKHLS